MAKQIHLILGVSIVLLGVVLSTGVLQGNEGFKVKLTDYEIEVRDTMAAIRNLDTVITKQNAGLALLIKDMNTLTDPTKLIDRMYRITSSNDTINNVNSEIFVRATKLAKSAQREADRLRTDSSRNDALNIEKLSATRGDTYASEASAVVTIAKKVAAKADSVASTTKQAQADALKLVKQLQSELDMYNKKAAPLQTAYAVVYKTYSTDSQNYYKAFNAYNNAVNAKKLNKPSKVLDDAVASASKTLNNLKNLLDKSSREKDISFNALAPINKQITDTKSALKSANAIANTSTPTVAAQCATNMANVLSRVTALSVSATASAAATNASVKAKVDAMNKAAAAKAAAVAAALAAQAAQADSSKKAAAKAAETAAAKAKADAAIANALSKKAADDKAVAAKAAKDRADAAARQAAIEKEASDAKIAAAKAEATAAAKAAALKASKEAEQAKAAAKRKAEEAESARKKAAKAKQDAENADAQSKIIALEKAARLQQEAENAAKQAKMAKEAHVEAKAVSKDIKKIAIETKKDAAADLVKKEEVPKTMEQLAKVPTKNDVMPVRRMKGGQRPIVINNMMPPMPIQQPMPRDNDNSFLSSAAGSFIGSGFGSLLGTSVSLAMHDAKIHEELRAGISAPPNSRNMSRYMDQRETQWTRGGRPTSREYSDPYNNIVEMNEDDPEVARWPGRNLEPVNLHVIGSEERYRGRRSRDNSIERPRVRSRASSRESRRNCPINRCKSSNCNGSCASSEPLRRYPPNIENDHSRE